MYSFVIKQSLFGFCRKSARLHQDCGANNKITNECAIFFKSVRELRGGFKEEAVLDSFFSGTRENTNSPLHALSLSWS